MKLKGVRITLPVCDLRPFLAQDTRLILFSNRTGIDLRPTPPFLKGFGARGRRDLKDDDEVTPEHKTRQRQWNPRKTTYFQCKGALSLPTQMPDGDGVVNHVSRVYIDGRALVRFELGIYSDISHLKPSSPQKYYDFARDFWNCQVILRTFEDRSELPLWKVFHPLVKHYEKATSPKHIRFSKSRSFNLCKVLLPQVQVIFETTDVDVLPPTSLRTNQDGNLYFGLSNLKMAGRGEKVPIVFLTHALHFKMLGDHPEFARLRSIRAHIAWLHADIELFLNLVLEGVKHPQLWDESSAFPDYLSEYANGFIEAIAKGDTLAPGLTSRYVAQLDPSRLERLRDAQQRLEKLKYPRSHEIVEKVNEFIRRCKRQSSHFQHFELD